MSSLSTSAAAACAPSTGLRANEPNGSEYAEQNGSADAEPSRTAGAKQSGSAGARPSAPRWELLRALGELTAATGERRRGICSALGLQAWSEAEHTELFVLELPPYASIHLSPDGKLGGEAADRVAGVWRTLGLLPPPDVDRLEVILSLYCALGEAAEHASSDLAKARFAHLRSAVFWEHLSPWARGYLEAVADAGAQQWAQLTMRALEREAQASAPPPTLALALRQAPDAIHAEISREELLDAVISPLRSGFVLCRRDLAQAAPTLGVGLRRGERRYALKAMLEQEPRDTVRWLQAHATAWSTRHRSRRTAAAGRDAGTDTDAWWAGRAEQSALALAQIAARVPS